MMCGIPRAATTAATAVIVASAIVLGAAQEARPQHAKTPAQSSDSQTPIKVSMFSGNEVRIGRLYNVLADCSSGPRPDVRIVKAPANGTVRAEAVQVPVDERVASPRANCNGKMVDATAITYKSNDDFVGEDKVTIDADYKVGAIRRFNWIIDVR
jgi:hypothetical protein